MRRLVQNMGWLLGGRGINAVLSLVYLALATRTLGLQDFGYFALIVALGQTVVGLANFQTWQFVVRWGADPKGPNEATGFAIALDLLALGLGTILAGALVWSTKLWLPLPDNLRWTAFGFCVVMLIAMRSTPNGLLRLHFRYRASAAAESVQPIVRAAGAALAAIYMPTVVGFILVWAVAEILVAATLWMLAARHVRIGRRDVSLARLPRDHPGAWRFVWSTNMTGSLEVGGKQVLLLLVGAFGGEEVAGGFRVASQLGQALVQLAQTVSKAIYPELIHARDDAHAIARRIANVALVAGVLAVVLTLAFGRWALEVIAGPEFRVYWTMVILAIAGAIELVGASLESLLVSANRAGTAFIVRAIPTVLAFLLLDTAIEWNGEKGAAFTVLGASAMAVLGFWIAILSMAKIHIVIEPDDEEEPKKA